MIIGVGLVNATLLLLMDASGDRREVLSRDQVCLPVCQVIDGVVSAVPAHQAFSHSSEEYDSCGGGGRQVNSIKLGSTCI